MLNLPSYWQVIPAKLCFNAALLVADSVDRIVSSVFDNFSLFHVMHLNFAPISYRAVSDYFFFGGWMSTERTPVVGGRVETGGRTREGGKDTILVSSLLVCNFRNFRSDVMWVTISSNSSCASKYP